MSLITAPLIIVFIAILLVIALVVFFVAICGRLVRSLLSDQKDRSSGEEARMLQEINRRLGRLESRIESLETIVTSTNRNNRI
jgi:hypothetical protein